MFSRDEAVLKSLFDLKHWRLVLRCGCGIERDLLLERLYQRYGGHPKLEDVLLRLRCTSCKGNASAAALSNTRFSRPAEQWKNIDLPDGRAQLVLWNEVR